MRNIVSWMMHGSAALGIGAGLVLACGCATLTPPSKTTKPTPSPAVAESTVKPSEEQKEATLALVEDFLERTRKYNQPVVEAPPTPVASSPSSPVVARPEPVPDQAFANTQVSISPDAPSKPSQPIPAVQSVSVRWSEPVRAGGDEPQRNKTTNSPLDLAPDETTAIADRFLERLRAEAQARKDFDSQWRLRMVQLALGRDAEAEQVSQEIPEPARTLLSAMIRTALAVRSAIRSPGESHADSLARAAELRDVLAENADPKITAVALCRKVVTFGSYEEMSAEEFVAGRSIQTIVYSEIANLRAEKSQAGLRETRLSTRLEVLTPAGQSVWQREEPEIVDRCRNRRQDFFVAQRITLPPTLPAGEYVLKVQVEDKVAEKIDEASVTFTVASPVSLAQNKKP